MADPGRQPPLETALHFAGQAGPREPLHAQDSAEAEGRNARSEIPAASDVPPAASRNAGAAAADSAQTLPAARPVFLRQLSDAAREGLITPERKAELRATSFAESCDLPPVMPALLRQISIAAKEGEISREERSQMKRSVLAGDAAALLDQLAHRPVESAHTKVCGPRARHGEAASAGSGCSAEGKAVAPAFTDAGRCFRRCSV